MSGCYISQKIEDEVLCFGIAFYKRRCIVKKNRVLEVPRLLTVIKTDDGGTFLKSYFVADEKVDKKKVAKNVLTHPCLVAIYLGLICMVTQVKFPAVITATVKYLGNCNSALTMLIVGTILADVKITTIFNKDTAMFSVFRLIILPTAALVVGLGLDATSLGISVLMTGMPAGATAAIFAARYDSDALFATRCVVMTTLMSMLTLPVWCYLAG